MRGNTFEKKTGTENRFAVAAARAGIGTCMPRQDGVDGVKDIVPQHERLGVDGFLRCRAMETHRSGQVLFSYDVREWDRGSRASRTDTPCHQPCWRIDAFDMTIRTVLRRWKLSAPDTAVIQRHLQ